MQTRYEPTMINDLQKCLDGCSDKIYGRSGLAVVVPDERNRPESVVWLSGSPDTLPLNVEDHGVNGLRCLFAICFAPLQ
jgi:hypothetical protein